MLSEAPPLAAAARLGISDRSDTRAENVGAVACWWCPLRSAATIPNWWRRARQRIPVVPRAEMLAELTRLKYSVAIAGTHGKTTTTSMVATFWMPVTDPTVINGGIINAYGTNAQARAPASGWWWRPTRATARS